MCQRRPGTQAHCRTYDRANTCDSSRDDLLCDAGKIPCVRFLLLVVDERGNVYARVGGDLPKRVVHTEPIPTIGRVRKPLRQDENVHVGPSDHVPWLTDRKWCYIRMEGTTFGDVPLNCEIKLEVWDSPNSAGVVIDAVRCAKLALDRGIGGPVLAPASYFMKSPPQQFTDDEARELVEAFIRGDAEALAPKPMPPAEATEEATVPPESKSRQT